MASPNDRILLAASISSSVASNFESDTGMSDILELKTFSSTLVHFFAGTSMPKRCLGALRLR